MRARRLKSLLAFASVLAIASPAAANTIGARIYIQPWDPHTPTRDAVQAVYDDRAAISGSIDGAWNTARMKAEQVLPPLFAEYDIGDGFRLYDINLTTNPITGYTLRQTGPDTARLEFTVSGTSLEASIRTPGPAPNGLDPRFRVSADLVVDVEIAFSTDPAHLLRAGKVNAVVKNVGIPEGRNDSAKVIASAAQIANDVVAFFSGTDFEQKLLNSINGQDLGQQGLQPEIDSGLETLNGGFARMPQLAVLLPKAVWADHDRVTFYFAPPPVAPTATGALSGAITWDPGQVAGACTQVAITGAVQTGPRPLRTSDGSQYGAPPTVTLGAITSFATGAGSCAYRVDGLGLGVPNALTVSSSFAPVGGFATGSPYTGNAHSAAVITPVGWDDAVITPNAANRNFTIMRGVAAGAGVGARTSEGDLRRPIGPGDEKKTPGGAVENTLKTQKSRVVSPAPAAAAAAAAAGKAGAH